MEGYGTGGAPPIRRGSGPGEEHMVYVGNQAYVPRLVQADLPIQRRPVPGMRRLSERARNGGSLRTLGGDIYCPSGMTLRPDDLVDPRPRKLPSGGTGTIPSIGAGYPSHASKPVATGAVKPGSTATTTASANASSK
eukprot:TRINITY_DN55114_c0_g1_i1.p1 TRINITY_DN55114_c0_g1~~TRINITY_DN55114_c0_g1_i1.p1  ORF type:complete len:137 (+),score=21.23 TRINITY_DN55114_c0_g1_i1:78-488(+)